MYEHNCAYARPSVTDDNTPIFAYGAAFDYLHYKEILRETGLPFFQILQCSKGNGVLELNNNSYSIEPGDVFIIPKDLQHRYYPVTSDWLLDWITFSGSAIDSIVSGLNINKFGIYKNKYSINIKTQIKEIINIYHAKKINRVIVSSPISYNILTELVSMNKPFGRLYPIIKYIEENYNKNITLEMMSNIINVTEYHVCRLFKNELSMRPFEYINKVRIQKAKELLSDLNLKISEISKIAGFENENYFRYIFKQITGTSPSMYRKKYFLLCENP